MEPFWSERILVYHLAVHFRVSLSDQTGGITTLNIGFESPGTNAELVPDSIAAMQALNLTGGAGIRFNGPATAPIAIAISHAVSHLYAYVAWYDPKLGAYVVAISRDAAVKPGDCLH